MLRKLLRNRKLSKLKFQANPIIDMAIQHLDRPTDLKDYFNLNLSCDFDTLIGNQEAALICDRFNIVVAMDIRLATLRFFGSYKSTHVFQCLAFMPELLNDQRALRSLHTYFNRLGLHDFAEDLLGNPNFNIKKKNKVERVKSLFSSNMVAQPKQKQLPPKWINDTQFQEDMGDFDFNHLPNRLVRHLSRVTLSEFLKDLLGVLHTSKMDLKRRREILYAGGELLIDQNIENALNLLQETKGIITDARFTRRVAQKLEKLNRSEEAIKLLKPANDQTSQRLCIAIQQRLQWKSNGYNIDYLDPVPKYLPIKDRVLYHVHASINHTTSGYSTRTHHICKALIEQGVDLHVRTRWGYPCDRKEVELTPEEISTEVIDNVTYLHDPLEEAFGTYAMEDYAQRAAHSLLRTALEIKPSVIHAASNHAVGFSAAMVARALNIPFVYEMRGLWALSRAAKDPVYRHQDRFQLEMALERHVALAADHVIVITDGLRAQLVEWGIPKEKISLAPNGVDTSRFYIQERETNLEQKLMLGGKTVIGYVGSLLKYEGLDLLLDAVASLPSLIRNELAVLIVGDGEYRTILERKTSELNLESCVIFTGKVPMTEVEKYYSIIDISPFPRISAEVCEMISPLKPLEAMAMGSVVVASNVRAIAEHVIHGKNGLLFEKGSSKDLADCLSQLIQHPEDCQKLAQQARTWVEERRNWNLVTHHISNVYQHLTSKAQLVPWKLDVLPAVMRNDILEGVTLAPEEITLLGVSEPPEINLLGMEFIQNNNWSLVAKGITLAQIDDTNNVLTSTPKWPSKLPVIDQMVHSSEVEGEINDYITGPDYINNTQPVLFVCNSNTTLEETQHAVSNFSILFSTNSTYLHDFIGIISPIEYLSAVFERIVTGKEEHKHQRKENWRRLILKNHPFLKLLNNSTDRSHLSSVDPLRYFIFIEESSFTDIGLLISQIICQRVLPRAAIIPESMNSHESLPIITNALHSQGIEVFFSNGLDKEKDALSSIKMDNEHVGLDFCLKHFMNNFSKSEEIKSIIPCPMRTLNQRVLIIGHDLKFIRSIEKTWSSWGIITTSLKTKNHSGALNISDQELLKLMSQHDIVFCEWALGNMQKVSQLRGIRPIFIRYHAQERKTEHLLNTSLISKDHMVFVSKHTKEMEDRLNFVNQVSIIPNAVDTLQLNIERNDSKGIGIMGITPQGKGVHRALEIVSSLKQKGIGEKLIIKGKLPKEYPWMKSRVEENEWYNKQFSKYHDLFERNEILQESFTPDVGPFVSSIQTILSVSDHESFHLAPLEAAAARTQVHMLPWAGSEDIHRPEWIFSTTEEIIQDISNKMMSGLNCETGIENRDFVMANYDLHKIAFDLLVSVLETTPDKRDTSPLLPQYVNFLRNLFPMKAKPASRLKIRSFTHNEFELHPIADSILREKMLMSKHTVILAHYVDLNLIDGSAVWYASMASMLATAGIHVICPIPSDATHSPVLQSLRNMKHVTILTPDQVGVRNYGRKTSFDDYVRIVSDLSEWHSFSLPVFCRGYDLIDELSRNSEMQIWAYLTDYYRHEEDGTCVIRQNTGALVKRISQQKGCILSQTNLIAEELANLGKIEIKEIISLPPMIPTFDPQIIKKLLGDTISIVYAGKIAPLWGVEPILDSADGKFKTTVIGDKIHQGPPHDSTFQSRMRKKVEFSDGITWIPRLPRVQVLEHLAQADLAWCARDAYFESQTRELSTKILEAILVGTPPIVTRSQLHEELLGKDWPFMLDSPRDISWKIDTARKISESEKRFSKLQEKLIPHDVNYVSSRFKKLLQG